MNINNNTILLLALLAIVAIYFFCNNRNHSEKFDESKTLPPWDAYCSKHGFSRTQDCYPNRVANACPGTMWGPGCGDPCPGIKIKDKCICSIKGGKWCGPMCCSDDWKQNYQATTGCVDKNSPCPSVCPQGTQLAGKPGYRCPKDIETYPTQTGRM